MLNITLSGGYTSESGGLKPIHDMHNPSEKRLLDILELLREGYGFLSMDKGNKNNLGPQQLEVYSEGGRYMLLFGVIDEDGEYEVKTLYYPNEGGMVIMHGEPYPAHAIGADFSPIIAACKEFLSTGDIVDVPLD
ncbi:hypothetical protein MUA02_11450 [Enterobacteriaceae bacterium H20N1]|uniref:Uncharacterized protein n=1 Tax=Dryocola boscaweniae TaxID=2925397 RepID=A0A9X2WAS5_9ENTR|nr:hypothetical protein [Dryocola boscaweniae]MCT4702479.1 hypothetical protein [Dryocola boscaweniae]MCT4719647.1 hypothetical protein [Dryocola boscaweniae]